MDQQIDFVCREGSKAFGQYGVPLLALYVVHGFLGLGPLLAVVVVYYVGPHARDLVRDIPSIDVPVTEQETENELKNGTKYDPESANRIGLNQTVIPCWDPCTMDYLGEMPATSVDGVTETVKRAKAAQEQWKHSSFDTRRQFLRIMLKYVVNNQETIARVAVRESGKTVVDAAFGEVLVTCEKAKWVINEGEKCLADDHRETGTLMMLKKVRVEYQPLGVIAAIVPWNYPFHNVFNPMMAAVFSGNAIVIKVSEYASWSTKYYGSIIQACLKAVGAPADLVQFVYGYGECGNALVTSDVDKIIFVGSPAIGSMVMKAASVKMTPVVLELGGKDPFVVCEDADIDTLVHTATRGVYQNMGQNCAGPERFLVYEGVYDEFCDKVKVIVDQMKQGPPLSSCRVDCGGVTMGRPQMKNWQKFVDDAVSKGGKVLSGGFIPEKDSELGKGQFYPPTVLAGVTEDCLIAKEEIFGPIMCIMKIKGNSDDEAVRIANNCDFGLSSCAFSGDAARAKRVASRLKAGMSSVNDLEGTTYMSQSLPFGGVGKSGFGRFAGAEGLRGLCLERSVCEDLIPSMRTSIPPQLQYPSTGVGADFAGAIIEIVYGFGVQKKAAGVIKILKALLVGAGDKQ